MKVALRVVVEVEPAEWAEEYGCDLSEVREDVRTYFTAYLAEAPSVEFAGLTVTVR